MINRFFAKFNKKVSKQATANAIQQRTSDDVFKEMLERERKYPSNPVSARDLLEHKLKYGGTEDTKLKAASDLNLVLSPRISESGGNLFTTREDYPKQLEELLKEQSKEPWRIRTNIL